MNIPSLKDYEIPKNVLDAIRSAKMENITASGEFLLLIDKFQESLKVIQDNLQDKPLLCHYQLLNWYTSCYREIVGIQAKYNLADPMYGLILRELAYLKGMTETIVDLEIENVQG